MGRVLLVLAPDSGLNEKSQRLIDTLRAAGHEPVILDHPVRPPEISYAVIDELVEFVNATNERPLFKLPSHYERQIQGILVPPEPEAPKKRPPYPVQRPGIITRKKK